MTEEDLSVEEQEELQKYLANIPQKEEKLGVFSFFNKVLKGKDTSKSSYLDKDELHSIRTYQSAALYADEMNLKDVGTYLKKEAEIVLSTSLGKEGFLIKQIVTQKKEITAKTVSEKKKKWLSKKEEGEKIGRAHV